MDGENMTIILKLKSGLEKYLERSTIEIELENKNTLLNVLKEINFPEEKAGIVLVDGMLSDKNCMLRGGETVKIFPQKIGC
jgi:hypothetical protein